MGLQCDSLNTVFGKPIFPNVLEKALDRFCVNGAAPKRFASGGDNTGGMVQYPSKGQPQFYQESQHVATHLIIAAEPMNRSGKDGPYGDKRACE
jgi:hypothetical protein